MDLIFVLLSSILAVIIGRIIYNKNESRRMLNKLPGPKGHFLIGNIIELMVSTDQLVANALERSLKYGPIFRLWVGRIPLVILSSPAYMEIILNNQKEIRKGFVYRMVEPWLGEGLLTSTGQRWFKHRKMLTPAFHFSILETFLPIFESKTKILIEKLKGCADTDEVVNIFPYITKCALDMICETAMGINVNAQNQEGSEYVKAVYKFSNIVVKRSQRLHLHSDLIFKFTQLGHEYYSTLKILHDFTNTAIRQRKVLREEELAGKSSNQQRDNDLGTKNRKAFLDLLLDFADTVGLTQEQVREEVDTFMFEGHDTTAAAMAWTTYLLGLHPKIQEEVYQEIKDIYGDDLTRPVTLADLKEMKLLERCIKEALRLYPSVPFISRTSEGDLNFGGYIVPPKTVISISIMPLHRNPTVWPDPGKFDPDRFLPDNVQKRHPFAYVPFSAGPRNCIGQKFALNEEKILLSQLILNYRIESVEKPDEITLLAELILRPKNGINVKLFKRPTVESK